MHPPRRNTIIVVAMNEQIAQPEQAAMNGDIRLKCVCDQELNIDPELLGRILQCPYCRRYLRPALQFLMADQRLAPNMTVLCTCGRFTVQPTSMAGKKGRCTACGQKIMLPAPVEREGAQRIVRVPPRVLQRQLRRVQGEHRRLGGDAQRLHIAGHRGRISLRPGQKVCANPECRYPLPAGGNVCPHCGTNVISGVAYKGQGPEQDPRGKWKRA